jgi:hypothetical protein
MTEHPERPYLDRHDHIAALEAADRLVIRTATRVGGAAR